MDFYRLCTICDPPRRHAASEAHKFKEIGDGGSAHRPIDHGAHVLGSSGSVRNGHPDPGNLVPVSVVESIAPPGECVYCDRRREINAASARKRRKAPST